MVGGETRYSRRAEAGLLFPKSPTAVGTDPLQDDKDIELLVTGTPTAQLIRSLATLEMTRIQAILVTTTPIAHPNLRWIAGTLLI
jgi:hypothetical protein